MREKSTAKRYTEEFRASAVALVMEQGKSIVNVSNELGVNKKSLQNWINATRATERDEFSKIRDLEAEVKFLRKELADSQETVEILKKTALIFSKK